jgi:hypothetical protein
MVLRVAPDRSHNEHGYLAIPTRHRHPVARSQVPSLKPLNHPEGQEGRQHSRSRRLEVDVALLEVQADPEEDERPEQDGQHRRDDRLEGV